MVLILLIGGVDSQETLWWCANGADDNYKVRSCQDRSLFLGLECYHGNQCALNQRHANTNTG
jgi:hypothetical protein